MKGPFIKYLVFRRVKHGKRSLLLKTPSPKYKLLIILN